MLPQKMSKSVSRKLQRVKVAMLQLITPVHPPDVLLQLRRLVYGAGLF